MQQRDRILVIEDNRALAVGLDLNLSAEGYEVTIAGDGERGLKLALEERPDLIVLDLMLPIMDGFEVLRRIREAGRPVPIIILSARSEERDKVKGLLDGADDYVVKPFGIPELQARITAALRYKRSPARPGEPLRFGRVLVDREARQVTRAGQLVALTAREFDLLLSFLEQPGRVHSREQLLRSAWGYNYEGTARTVDNFVRSLRAKLEENPTTPEHIITVHGVGYRFDP